MQNQTVLEPTMKWYKFVIWIQLFVSLMIGFFNGLSMITGSVYSNLGGDAAVIWATYPGLQYIDWSYGLVLIGWAVFAVYVRQRLANYRKDGPRLYLLFLIISLAAAVVYNLICGLIVGGLDGAGLLMTVLCNGLFIWLNSSYFKKRQRLFVN
ncbi:MAG: hypothetical protein IJX71_07640 [Oscillospiraceae bacterium]|nr:hypothetical protein [Oscillospiraceae bacterium]